MKKNTIAMTLHWTYVEGVEVFDVSDRAALVEEPDVVVPVGVAPDGLPLVLEVRRSASVIEPLLRALSAPSIDRVSAEVRDLVRTLDRTVQHERRALGVLGTDSERPCYVSGSSVDTLFGSTLCMRLLGGVSPLLLPGDALASQAYSNAIKTSAGVLMNAAELAEVRRALDHTQRLALPLDDSAALVARHPRTRNVDVSDLVNARPVLWEDLRALPSTQFHTYRRVQGEDRVEQFQGTIGDSAGYARAVVDADAVAWSVTRHDLAHMVLQVARSLIPLHKDDIVHGDIKPANILIVHGGAVAHDSLQLPAGTIAAVGTKGWNAPEQIMARPVSPATDIFALAQLLILVLDAAAFGDERAFIVPVGGRERIRENFLPEPDVFIDPSRVALADEHREAWRVFLRRCLQLDASRRPIDAGGFARQLEELLARAPLPGRKAVTGLIGSLRCQRSKAATSSGSVQLWKPSPSSSSLPLPGPGPVWVLRDAPRA